MTQPTKSASPSAVVAAEQVLAQSRAALVRERLRSKQTQDQVAAISVEIGETDPEDTDAFAKLVSARDALRGRLEALATREGKAAADVAAAEEALQQAKAAAVVVELASLEAEIAEADAACTAEAEAAEQRLLTMVRRVRQLVEKRRELEMLRRQAAGEDEPSVHSMAFGSDWAATSDSRVGSRAFGEMREFKASQAIHRSYGG